MSRLWSLWRNLWRKEQVERDLDDEMRATLDLLAEEKVRAGHAPDDARRIASLELGGVESVKQQVRDARRGAVLDTVVRDVRHAARLLWRNPLFTLTAALSLAIGIGATTAIFTVANGLLLRAATGVADPTSLIDIVRRDPRQGPGVEEMSYPDLVDVRQHATLLDEVFGYQLTLTPASLNVDDSSSAVFASVVTTNYFRALGVTAAAGRVFDAGDVEQAGASPIVVLSHEFWLRRFDGDSGVVGRGVRINNVPMTIAGVAAGGFRGVSVVAPDLWVPVSAIAALAPEGGGVELTDRRVPWLMLGARLKPGVSRAQASAELAGIGAAIQRDTPSNPFIPEGAHEVDSSSLVWSAEVASPIPYGLRVLAAGFLGLLMTLVAVVLVIACANLGGVLLAKATGRRREIAVRTAVGAGRARLVRQLLTETVLLFALGGIAGLALARGITTLLISLLPEFPLPVSLSVPLDLRVVAFALVLSFIAAILAGLAPALHASKSDVVTALKDDVQGPVDRLRLRNTFVVAQVAFSVLLVVVAALLVRAFDNVISVKHGFDPRDVEVASLDLTMGGYTNATGGEVVRRLRERVRAIPGVARASIADHAPAPGGRSFGSISVPGAVQPGGRSDTFTNWTLVEPDYFRTVGIPLMAGRDFTDADGPGAELVVIVGQRTAKRLWPDRDPIGQLVSVRPPQGPQAATLQPRDPGTRVPDRQLRVVGVVGDLNFGTQGDSAPLSIYVPFQQKYLAQITILARRKTEGQSLAQELRSAVASIDPNLPVLTTELLERQNNGPVQTQLRVAATVAGSVGIIGLFLAGIGIYGVTAYAVTRRTREIGIRLSLGASSREVIGLVLRQGMRLVVIGSAIGLALGIGAGKLLSGRRFGIPQADPAVLIGAGLLFAVVGLVACYIPVRRAASIRATEALRYE
ncbi:MAG TPA: ABC transporter permease [Vicinamibacterales bacterium]|nr:ABC transporter permease [Vicinamibacterales bacterium]